MSNMVLRDASASKKVAVNANEEHKPLEAWVSRNTESVAADTMQKLMIIGRHLRYFLNLKIILK